MEPVLKLWGSLNWEVCQTSALCSWVCLLNLWAKGAFRHPPAPGHLHHSCLEADPPSFLLGAQSSWNKPAVPEALQRPEGSQHCLQEASWPLKSGKEPCQRSQSGEVGWGWCSAGSVVSWLREVHQQKSACLFSSRTNLRIIQHPDLDRCKWAMEEREQEAAPGLKGERDTVVMWLKWGNCSPCGLLNVA